jgi:hypothetical protein
MVRALPNIPVPIRTVTNYTKVASKDIILVDEKSVPIDTLADLLFEDIGGQEIIGISRHDTIDGKDIDYSPIKNLSSILSQYSPQNILSLQDSADTYFNNFTIKLDAYLVDQDSGTGPNGKSIYLDPITGDLVINFINLSDEEQVQVQILNSGEIISETDIIES